MRTELRPITVDDIPRAIQAMNASSAGYSFAFNNLDLFRFAMLSRFWQFSYGYSYLALQGGAAAGAMINCVDAASREAYSFYWGVAPEFQRTRVAWEMVHSYLGRLKREGFARAIADASADSPATLYAKLGFQPACELVELAADGLPGSRPTGYAVRPLDLEALIARATDHPSLPWTARPYFLKGASSLLEAFGAWRGGELRGWVALSRWTGFPIVVVLDWLPGADDAASDILLSLPALGFTPPFTATHMPAGGRARALLERLGLRTRQRWVHLSLDLEQYSPRC